MNSWKYFCLLKSNPQKTYLKKAIKHKFISPKKPILLYHEKKIDAIMRICVCVWTSLYVRISVYVWRGDTFSGSQSKNVSPISYNINIHFSTSTTTCATHVIKFGILIPGIKYYTVNISVQNAGNISISENILIQWNICWSQR